MPISPDALALVRRSLGGDLTRVLDEPDGPAVLEVRALASHAIEYHLERRIRSLHVL
jgi:phage baseplate assembly protein W